MILFRWAIFLSTTLLNASKINSLLLLLKKEMEEILSGYSITKWPDYNIRIYMPNVRFHILISIVWNLTLFSFWHWQTYGILYMKFYRINIIDVVLCSYFYFLDPPLWKWKINPLFIIFLFNKWNVFLNAAMPKFDIFFFLNNNLTCFKCSSLERELNK